MNLSSFTIVYMGTPDFAVAPLEALLGAGMEVSAVVTQPVRPRGRGRRPMPSPVEAFARERGISVLTPGRIRDEEFMETLRSLSPDLIVVVAYGKILPTEVLTMPRLGCVNLHASLLPAYRGAAPINYAIMKGERETGLTTMLMDEGMDTGPMLLKERVLIGEDETAGELTGRLSEAGAGLLLRTIEALLKGEVAPEPQDNALATYAPSLKKKDGLIDWTRGAKEIKNLVRGVSPWPGAFTERKGRVLKIHRVQAHEDSEGGGEGIAKRPGAIVRVERESFFVAGGRGLVEVLEVQPENKKRMSAGDFIKGYRPAEGEILGRG